MLLVYTHKLLLVLCRSAITGAGPGTKHNSDWRKTENIRKAERTEVRRELWVRGEVKEEIIGQRLAGRKVEQRLREERCWGSGLVSQGAVGCRVAVVNDHFCDYATGASELAARPQKWHWQPLRSWHTHTHTLAQYPNNTCTRSHRRTCGSRAGFGWFRAFGRSAKCDNGTVWLYESH